MVSVLVVLLGDVPTTPCGVPLIVALPLPLSVKARSDGNAPNLAHACHRAGRRYRDRFRLIHRERRRAAADRRRHRRGSALLSVRTNTCVWGVSTPLFAVMVNVALVPDSGTPLNVPVPLPLSKNARPAGIAPAFAQGRYRVALRRHGEGVGLIQRERRRVAAAGKAGVTAAFDRPP